MKPTGKYGLWWTTAFILLCGMKWASLCAAAEHHETFDADKPSWKVRLPDPETLQLRKQVRSLDYAHQRGEQNRAEYLEVESTIDGLRFRLEHQLPAARVIGELKLSLWYRANADGARLAVRVVFPAQKNPQTGDTLSVLIEGDEYTRVGRWQQLACGEIEVNLRKKLPLLQAQVFRDDKTSRSFDLRGMYVDRAVLMVPTGRGVIRAAIDDLLLVPLVTPAAAGQIVQAGIERETPAPELTFEQHRLQFQGRPFFPRAMPYHGEKGAVLAKLGFNLVWVPNYRDQPLLQELQANGLRAMATPPRAQKADDTPDSDVSLIPLGAETSPILIWYLGTRVPADAKGQLVSWAGQVRNADRIFKRPVMADVSAQEQTYSRHVDLLGSSRHTLHSGFNLKNYRNWLVERRQFAQPGSFLWTWIQTEPVSTLVQDRRAAGLSPIVVEPEQIRLLTYTALSAGYRGIAWWTPSALDTDEPGSEERRLILAQLNCELELLEPWLATATLQTQIPFNAALPTVRAPRQLDIGFGKGQRASETREQLLRERDNQFHRQEQLPRELSASLFRTDYGLLLLPVWYGESAQFVPSQLAANNAVITVPGVDEMSAAWEVTTTSVHSLDNKDQRKRVAGGVQITLPKFDQTSAIVFTSDPALVQRLREKMESLQQRSAEASLQLARAKVTRVTVVDRELHSLGVGQPDSAQLLSLAASRVEQAQSALQRRDCSKVREYSNEAMEATRILQAAYWADATRKLSSPVASPHALCFQTLPDHWRMVQRIGRAAATPVNNLLRSGDFEDKETLVSEGWRHERTTIDGVRSRADLDPRAHKGTYALRLIAAPASKQPAPTILRERPVSYVSPPMIVRKGQLVYIDGWVRMVSPSIGSTDGALIYDSLGGPLTALRWTEAQRDWQHFQILREVPESQEMTLTVTLTGLGELLVDDLRVLAYDPETESPEGSPGIESPGKPKPSPFDFLKKLPGFGVKENPTQRKN